MNEDRFQFWTLYLARFAEGFGFITLITLLPYYINTLAPTDTTVLGLTISAGLIVGLYTTGFTFVAHPSHGFAGRPHYRSVARQHAPSRVG